MSTQHHNHLMIPPVIVDDAGDLLVFESVEAAERYVEPWSVEDLIAYDSKGRLLHFVVEREELGAERKTRLRNLLARMIGPIERVKLQPMEADPTHASELCKVLTDFFAKIGVPQYWLSGASLEELIAKAQEYRIR